MCSEEASNTHGSHKESSPGMLEPNAMGGVKDPYSNGFPDGHAGFRSEPRPSIAFPLPGDHGASTRAEATVVLEFKVKEV